VKGGSEKKARDFEERTWKSKNVRINLWGQKWREEVASETYRGRTERTPQGDAENFVKGWP